MFCGRWMKISFRSICLKGGGRWGGRNICRGSNELHHLTLTDYLFLPIMQKLFESIHRLGLINYKPIKVNDYIFTSLHFKSSLNFELTPSLFLSHDCMLNNFNNIYSGYTWSTKIKVHC